MPVATRIPKYLFGSRTRERVLRLIGLLEQTYPSQLAIALKEPLMVVQRTTADLERDGILASRAMGRTRMYELNKRYQHYHPLRDLLAQMGQSDPETVAAARQVRQRPRRAAKPI